MKWSVEYINDDEETGAIKVNRPDAEQGSHLALFFALPSRSVKRNIVSGSQDQFDTDFCKLKWLSSRPIWQLLCLKLWVLRIKKCGISVVLEPFGYERLTG